MRLQEERIEQERRRKRGRFSLLVAGVLAIATLLGYSVLVPRVTVTASDPVDPEQPFSSSITIANGLIPLDSVQPSIALDDIGFLNSNGRPIHLKAEQPYQTVLAHNWAVRDMGTDEQMTFAMNDLPIIAFSVNKKNLIDARIAVLVNYRLPIVHIAMRKPFYFFAKRQTNGNFYWYHDSTPK